MAGHGRSGLARRVLAVATAVMPRSRRDWGRAMSAELACARTRGERAELVLGAARVALLPPPGVAGYRRTMRRSAGLAVIAYIPLGLGLYLGNVVFPAAPDRAAGVLALEGYVLVVLMAAGALTGRMSARRGAPIIAGMTAGLVIAVLGMATFAAIDNAFLSIVSHQQDNIAGFRASGMTSIRAYINGNLEETAPGLALVWTVAGAAFAPLGAALARQVRTARSRMRLLPRR